jgi:hypothetical protein
MVKLRGDEDAEDAVRRWLFSERGQLHAAQASGERSTGTLVAGEAEVAGDGAVSDLFKSVDVVMTEVQALTGRERGAPDRLEPIETMRNHAADNERRKGKRLRNVEPSLEERQAEADLVSEHICQKTACVEARAELDASVAKVGELQQMRHEVIDLARALILDDVDQPLCIAARSFQVALMDILDGITEDENSDEEEASAGGSDATTSRGSDSIM